MFLILLYTTTDYPNSYVDINPTKEQNNHSIKLNKGARGPKWASVALDNKSKYTHINGIERYDLVTEKGG